MASSTTTKETLVDLSPLLKLYTDGTVERLIVTPHTPPTPFGDPTTNVSSKDILNPCARLYLPKLINPTQKLPILIYFHGGGFSIESAFSSLFHRYLNILASQANTLIVSVEYRLAPEHPLPAGYDDAWTALKWVCSHALDHETLLDNDPWITNHGDFNKIFVGGDSSGANMAHNLAMRAGSDPLPGNLKLFGSIISNPYFWGSSPLGSEPKEDIEEYICYRLWTFAYPNAVGGIDNPMVNPIVDGAPSLSGLGGTKMMVCLSEKDIVTARGKAYADKVKKSGWKGEVEVVEVEGEDHCFHVFDPECDKAKDLIKRIASFISR